MMEQALPTSHAAGLTASIKDGGTHDSEAPCNDNKNSRRFVITLASITIVAVVVAIAVYFGTKNTRESESGSQSVSEESGICSDGTQVEYPDRQIPFYVENSLTCAEADATFSSLSLPDDAVEFIRLHCGCPGSYGAEWCKECGSLLGQCDASKFNLKCPDVSTLKKTVDPAIFEGGLKDWYGTHGTIEWNVWPVPTFSIDLSIPWMEYSAWMYATPSVDCCKYSAGEARARCAELSNHTYSPYVPYTDDLPMFDAYTLNFFDGVADRTYGTGGLVNVTVLEATPDHALVHICVQYQLFPYEWFPNFGIWARNWMNISSDVVDAYERKIQGISGPDVRFYRKPDPVDPKAPYDEFWQV